jgi:hypothetical protein
VSASEIGGDDGERAGGVGGGEELFVVVNRAGGVGILHEHAEAGGGRGEGAVVADDDVDAEGLGAGADDVDGLWVAGGGDEERVVGAASPSFRRWHIIIASAAAVPSSSIEPLAISRPVRSVTSVWKFRSASRRPWEISAW